MTPKALLLPALEGNTDAQGMLADYLKENGVSDHTAEEAYFGAIHIRWGYRAEGMPWAREVEGSGAGYGSRHGAGAGAFGARRGRGGGYGSAAGIGRGYS